MWWLGARDSIYAAAGAPFPGGRPAAERAVLYDGLAARRLVHASNLFSQQITFAEQRVNIVAVAGWSVNRTLTTPLQARGRRGSTWGTYQPMVVEGTTAYAELPEPWECTGVQIVANTSVSGTAMTFGEILIGAALELPEPSSVEVITEVPTVVNGDFAVRVGIPRREVRIGWPPQADRRFEAWVRDYAGETGLLVVDGMPIFGRLGTSVSSGRTIEHDFYEAGSVSIFEVAGGEPWS